MNGDVDRLAELADDVGALLRDVESREGGTRLECRVDVEIARRLIVAVS